MNARPTLRLLLEQRNPCVYWQLSFVEPCRRRGSSEGNRNLCPVTLAVGIGWSYPFHRPNRLSALPPGDLLDATRGLLVLHSEDRILFHCPRLRTREHPLRCKANYDALGLSVLSSIGHGLLSNSVEVSCHARQDSPRHSICREWSSTSFDLEPIRFTQYS